MRVCLCVLCLEVSMGRLRAGTEERESEVE